MEQELRTVKADCDSSAAETKKVSVLLEFFFFKPLPSQGRTRIYDIPPQLREELERARQTHSGEVEGMRREVSKLTRELHQRDLSISALSGASSGVQQQLRGEMQRAEQKAAELKVSL